jgi:AcrR family transcriptional regulator
VAARAGVSKGTLYLYFDSKEALFRAVIEESVLPLIEASEARVVANLDDPARSLRALLVEWWSASAPRRWGHLQADDLRGRQLSGGGGVFQRAGDRALERCSARSSRPASLAACSARAARRRCARWSSTRS